MHHLSRPKKEGYKDRLIVVIPEDMMTSLYIFRELDDKLVERILSLRARRVIVSPIQKNHLPCLCLRLYLI
jgi:hypothetical protein